GSRSSCPPTSCPYSTFPSVRVIRNDLRNAQLTRFCGYDRSMVTNGSVQSVDRAARVLEILARDGAAGVGAVARELEVHGSTASRLIAALEGHELIERDRASGTVRLGMGVLRLAAATRASLDLTAEAGPVCDALAEELGETVNVA